MNSDKLPTYQQAMAAPVHARCYNTINVSDNSECLVYVSNSNHANVATIDTIDTINGVDDDAIFNYRLCISLCIIMLGVFIVASAFYNRV